MKARVCRPTRDQCASATSRPTFRRTRQPTRCCRITWAGGRVTRVTRCRTSRIRRAPAPSGAWAADRLPGPVTWVQPNRAAGIGKLLRVGSVAAALRIARAARSSIAAADVVHVHSNGLLAEMGALLAERARKPVVLTLYGTEIWHYAPKRPGPDLFTRAYRHASHVTFYSHGLQTRAVELGLARHQASVVYPPVAERVLVPRRARAGGNPRVAGYPAAPHAGQRQAASPAGRPALSARGARRSHPHSSGYAAGDLRYRSAAERAEGHRAGQRRAGARDVRRPRGQPVDRADTTPPPTRSCCRRCSRPARPWRSRRWRRARRS